MVTAHVTLGRRGAPRGDHRLTMAHLAAMVAAVGVALALLVEGDVPTDHLGPVAGQLAVPLVFAIMLGLRIALGTERGAHRAAREVRGDPARGRRSAPGRWGDDRGVTTERPRVAQEIHDTLAHGFTCIAMLAPTVAAEVAPADTAAATRRHALIEQTARENRAEARGLVAAVSPVALDDGVGTAWRRGRSWSSRAGSCTAGELELTSRLVLMALSSQTWILEAWPVSAPPSRSAPSPCWCSVG